MRLNTVSILIIERGNSYIHECGCNLIAQAALQMAGQICTARMFFLGFPDSPVGKESIFNVGNLGLIPGLGLSPEEGNSYRLQYSGLENSMDCIVHGVTKTQTQLSDFHFHRFLDCPEQTKCTKCLRPIYIITCMDES